MFGIANSFAKKFAFCRFWLNTSNFQLWYVSTVFNSWVLWTYWILVTYCYLDILFPSVSKFTWRLGMWLLIAVALVLDGALATCFLHALGQTLDNLHMSLNVQIPTTMASLSLSLIKCWITYSSFIIRKQFAIAWLRSLNFKLLNCEVISYIYNIRLFGLLQNQHYCNYINSIEYILNHFTQYTCGKWRPKPKSQSSHAYCNLKHMSLSTKNNHSSLFTCYFISFWVWSHSIWLVLCMLRNSGAPNYHELPQKIFFDDVRVSQRKSHEVTWMKVWKPNKLVMCKV